MQARLPPSCTLLARYSSLSLLPFCLLPRDPFSPSILTPILQEIKEEMVKIRFENTEVEDFKLCCTDAMQGFVIGKTPPAYSPLLSSCSFVFFHSPYPPLFNSPSHVYQGHKDTSETVAANSFDCPLSGMKRFFFMLIFYSCLNPCLSPLLGLTLVDFAGQLDTNGHEIEIANTVGLYNTLSRVRSVRLVLVIDFNTINALKGQVRRRMRGAGRR